MIKPKEGKKTSVFTADYRAADLIQKTNRANFQIRALMIKKKTKHYETNKGEKIPDWF